MMEGVYQRQEEEESGASYHAMIIDRVDRVGFQIK
jgi:hypothetical protein